MYNPLHYFNNFLRLRHKRWRETQKYNGPELPYYHINNNDYISC